MARNDLLLAIVTDCSGSMRPLAAEMVNGFNRLVADQAAEAGRTWVTHVAFDQQVKVHDDHRAWGAADLPKMTVADYERYQGMTALCDAVGTAITDTRQWLADNPWFDGKVLVAVFTDGYENASQEYDHTRVAALKTACEADGWAFLFVGAGIDAWAQAAHLGYARGQTISADRSPGGTHSSYAGMSTTASSYRNTGDATWQGDKNTRTAEQ